MTSRRRTTLEQRWNDVTYINAKIYSVEQRRINVVHFDIDINNARQCWNNFLIFSIEFQDIDQRQNNVVNINICKKLERAKKYFWSCKKTENKKLKLNTLEYNWKHISMLRTLII